MWLSYLEARAQLLSGRLTWGQYIDQLLSRAAGGGNVEDDVEGMYNKLKYADQFGWSMWSWTGKYMLKDVTPIKDVFVTYRTGSTDELEEKLKALRQDYAREARTSLALLALQERRADVLKPCMDQGINNTYMFEDEANRVDGSNDPKTFDVLEKSEFRKYFPREKPWSEKTESERKEAERKLNSTDPAVIFDKGGKYPVEW